MPVPNTFATATAPIPLSQLDANFATAITLGNTAIQLGNTVTTLNNMTLANVTISSGNVTITNVSVTTANVATANVTTSQILNYGTANGVAYLNTNKALTTGTSLVFDGTNMGIGVTSPSVRLQIAGSSQLVRLQNDDAYIQFANSANTDTCYIQQTASAFNIFSQLNVPMVFGTNSVARMRLDASGNLGIGTSSPNKAGISRALTINGAANAGLELAAGDSLYGLIFANASRFSIDTNNTGANIINFYTSGSERARFTSGGEFLLGATALTSNGFFTNAGTSAALTSVSGTNVRAWAQTYSASASNNATVDAWLGLDAAGNVFGNGPMIGHFFVNVVGASGLNQFSGVYSIVTTSNGTTNATLAAVSTVTRGTSPVTSVQIANNGAGGAIKLTITYINNSGVVTGGSSRVTFIGQIS